MTFGRRFTYFMRRQWYYMGIRACIASCIILFLVTITSSAGWVTSAEASDISEAKLVID